MELLYFKIFEIPDKELKICNKDFNLNGRYNFSVDSKTNQIDFTINDNYIDNFYGKDIKINAVVGKNGLGKTTLLKFIQFIICKLNSKHNVYEYPFAWWHWCAIHSHNKKLYYSESKPSNRHKEENNEKTNDYDNYLPVFDELYNIESKLFDIKIDKSFVENNYKSTSIFYSPFFEFEESKVYPVDYIDVSNDYLFNESLQDKEVSEQALSQTLNFRREEIKRQISFIEFGDNILDDSNRFYKDFIHNGISVIFNGLIKKLDKNQRYIDYDDFKFYEKFDEKYIKELNSTKRYLRGKTDWDYYFFIGRNSFYKRIVEILFYTIENRPEPKQDEKGVYRYKLLKYNFSDEDYKKSIPELFELFILNLNIEIDNNELYRRIQICVNEIIKKFKSFDLNDDSFIFDIGDVKDFLRIERDIFEILPKNIDLPLFSFDWPNLSTGEKAYLNLFSRLHFGLFNKLYEDKFNTINLVYVLIDEGSTGFHPQWQKEFLKRLILFTNQINPIKKHFIITSHSPYLLSDLQIEDVISIGESDDYRFTIKNTFGANIHELLADKFYLENTFMGDFAREKIEEIGKELIDEKIKPSIERLNEIEKIINIIGEPILKERLEFLLAEKRGLQTKDKIILELKNEIKRLKGN